jgi:hypothetical protein
VREREGEVSLDSGALEQLWRSFADLGAFEANVLDPSEENADGVAEALARQLEDGRLLI